MGLQGARLATFTVLLLAACAALLGAALLLGSGGLDAELIVTLRAPRVLAAAGVGALLALSGLAMQVLLRNPLADPYVLGTSGGASVGALLALLGGVSLWIGAAGGALLSGALLLALARSALAASDDASSRLILTGAMLASVAGALATLLLTLTPDERLRGAIFWLVGDLSGAQHGGACLLAATVFALALIVRRRSVDRLMLGSEAAALLGEPVRRLRYELLVAASLAAGLAVATAGAIGFVGLVAPQLLRMAGVQRTRELAWMSAVGGAALLVAADLAARTVAAPMELPVGAVMALIGAPLFIGFLMRGAR
jgi:iron complex transport system permease protein